MTSYLSNILTNTTSRYNSLRRTLLNDETDGDTEDDSHISRVLRAYYTEKGRGFPSWLPPDPKAPQQAPVQMVTSARGQQPMMNQGRGAAQQPPYPSSNSRGLGDLWGDSPAQQPNPQSQSLRARRGAPGARSPGIADGYEARPLPSQRAGSYQTQGGPPSRGGGGRMEQGPPGGGGGGGTAQERLKARLWGSGRTSPAPSTASTGSTGGGGGGMPYPDGGGRSARMPYPDDQYGGGGGGYDAGGGGGGGGYGGGRQARKPVGLPSGPRAGRF